MAKKISTQQKGILLMIFSSVCSCVGQLFWKLFTLQNSYLFLCGGFLLYGIGALSMIIAYRFGKLSVLQPVLSLNYVFSLIFAAIILNEDVSLFKIAGVIFIIYGLIQITAESRTTSEAEK